MQGPLVRATLEGRKTQTRRPIKPQPDDDIVDVEYDAIADLWLGNTQEDNDLGYTSSWAARCPLGKAGDRLWVRETWGIGARPCPVEGGREGIEYRADEGFQEDDISLLPLYSVDPPEGHTLDEYCKRGWRPSIHMPRWACRLVLPLVSVRVERVQDITEEDAKAEGVERISAGPGWECWMGYGPSSSCKTARDSFCALWISIYGVASWDANPWVWVAEWKEIEGRK
jgi:hypothetical protein